VKTIEVHGVSTYTPVSDLANDFISDFEFSISKAVNDEITPRSIPKSCSSSLYAFMIAKVLDHSPRS
jgi:hypothetical protein